MSTAPLRRPQAVILDMDGLLLDTERLAALAWHEAAAAHGVTFDAALAVAMVGHNFDDCTRLARAHCPPGYPVDAVLGAWHATYDTVVAREGLVLKPGVHELLDWLDGAAIPRAVATSTRRARAQAKLAQAGIWPRLHALVGGDEVARGKPAPDIYLEAARRLGCAPASCVALEDSAPGTRAALAAGMTAFVVPDLVAPPPDLWTQGARLAASLHEVRALLADAPAPGAGPEQRL
jgi:HAD superfamily hydrolase (TIGR01509 family)